MLDVVLSAVLSAFLRVLFAKIGSSILDEVKKQHGVERELQNLGCTLKRIEAVLSGRSQSRSPMAEQYLRDLKDVAYDANDVLDEYMTEATRRRHVRLRKVRSSTSAFNLKRLIFQHSMSECIDRISKRLDAIVRDNNLNSPLAESLHLEKGEPCTSSLIGPSRALGREKEIESILRLLTTDEHSVEGLLVVLIQGTPGIGKTFLARVVYNEERVDNHFHLRIWVHVPSNGFHVLTKIILETIERKEYGGLPLEILKRDLKSKLEGRRFLLVLDNLWDLISHEDWEDLLVPLRYAARGSRILVTTRTKTVAKFMRAEPICLGKLSYEATMSLFCQEAFEDPHGFNSRPDLLPTIREIVRKCQGSPLAAKTLGSLLHFETDAAHWESILQSDISGVLQGEMLNCYMLSYQLLPGHIRRCFEYLAVFPRDYEFQKEVLIRLWMAQDYIRTRREEERLEDVGGEYFDFLLNLSCFQSSSGGGDLPKYVVHEHFHHLAFEVSKEECCIIEQ